MKVKLLQPDPSNPGYSIEKEIYLDGILKDNLDLACKHLRDDWDQVWFVDGAEGAGKSNLAITLAYYVSPEERRDSLMKRIVLKIEDAPMVIKGAKQYDSIVIDEGYGGMSASGHMARLNKMLQRIFTEIRAKNLFIFIVAPTFMDINRYFAIWRSRCLLHVYSDKNERGYCAFYNAERKKKLFIVGRAKYYNYALVKPNFRFRFTNIGRTLIDWETYKKMKSEKNLNEGEEEPSAWVMRAAWMKILRNIPKLTKPLTQEQYVELVEMARKSIIKYTKIIGDELPKEFVESAYNTKILNKVS